MHFKEEFKTVGFFYVMTALFWISIGIMGAYWTLYFVNLGIPYASIAIIMAMVPIASILFEIPTGAIADIYGRKVSVFISYLLTGLAYVGILLSGKNVLLLSVLYFIVGIAFTFESGALESWFVDTVKHKKKQKYMHRLFGRWGSIAAIGFVIGPFVGGLLVKQGLSMAFWTTAVVMLFLSLFVLVFGKEEYFVRRKPKIIEGFRQSLVIAKKGFRFATNHHVIFTLSLVMILLTFANTISYGSYQPYVVGVGLNPEYLGFALAIAGFISIFTLNYSHKIVKSLGGNRKSLLIFTALVGLAIIGVGLFKYLPLLFVSLVGYTAIFEFAGGTAPAFRELFNKFVPSNMRATIISITSFGTHIGQILGFLAFGLISTYISLKAGIIIGGTIILLTSLIYFKLKKD
jgi:MFS family permease